MKKVLCILILLLFNAFLCFSYEIDYVESFQLSKINFSQKINILSENLLIHEFETEVNLEIEPVQNINEKIECIIFCEPKGNGRSYTDTMVPIDFEVFLNKNRTDIWVINDGKKYSYREALNQNGYSNNISEIHFSINIEGKTELILKYVNMSIIGRMEIGFDIEKVNYRFASNNSYKEIKYIEKPNSNDTLFLTNIVPFKENEYRYDYYGEFYGKHYDGFYSECDGITGFDIKREITENNTLIWTCVIPKETEIIDCWMKEINTNYLYENSTSLLKEKNVFFMTRSLLAKYRNAFYAIYGYEFKNIEWKNFFTDEFLKYGIDYKVNPNFSESDLNETERKNIELIRKMESITEPILLSEFLKKKLY